MTPKFVLLWTDAVLWLLVAALAWYGWHVRRNPNLRDTWSKVFADAPSLCAALVIALFLIVTLLDSVHYRRALPPSATAAAGAVAYDTRTTSLLDAVLAGLVQSREASYSVPLATVGFTKETRDVGGQPARVFPRLSMAAPI
jgi:peptide/nickel transport system permease protein